MLRLAASRLLLKPFVAPAACQAGLHTAATMQVSGTVNSSLAQSPTVPWPWPWQKVGHALGCPPMLTRTGKPWKAVLHGAAAR